MSFAALLIYPALLLLLTFYGAAVSGRGKCSPDFLRPEQTRMIQAAACVGIMLHHLTQQVTSYGVFTMKRPITIFNYLGVLFTALFFFISGYGLLTSLSARPDYLRSFLQRRLPSVLLPFWLINALGILLNMFGYKAHYTASEILSDLFGITLVNSNGWFIVEIVILYLIFYVLFRLIRNRDAALALLCLATLLLIAYSFRQGHDPSGAKVHWFRGEWWYNSTITFIYGLLFARFKEKLTSFWNRHYAAVLTVSVLFAVVTLHNCVYCVNRYGYYQTGVFISARFSAAVTLASQSAACIAFVTLVLLLQMRISIGNRALAYMSTISRELFLIHGYFVSRIFGSVRMEPFLRYAAVISCSIAAAAVISPCIRRIVKYVISFLTRNIPEISISPSTVGQLHRSRRFRKVLAAVFASALVCLGAVPLFQYLRAGKEYAAECETLRHAKVGDEVLWGRYETAPEKWGKERVTWIVIGKEEGRLCLLSKYGLAGSWYHQKHEPVTWEDSNLRALLNSESSIGAFSRYEKKNMLRTDGDLVTLLTVKQAEEAFSENEDRILFITEAAWRSGTNANPASLHIGYFERGYCYSWWWLRGEPGEKSITAPIVDPDGSISVGQKAVNKPSGAIRPVIWVDPDLTGSSG